MSDTVIRVDRLSKQYQLGMVKERHDTLRDQLSDSFLSMFRRSADMNGAAQSEQSIWALKDVCFEVKRGDVLGVIGRNGAGKSTLLKILSRITHPDHGRVEIFGRVGSLLEVGTGFHGELTGRENIYLNGAILGMRKSEIERKFDEIVAFAEVEKFLDTPVKRYSSGMYVRLAFAVAAHLEPEILIIDEVLAVGDLSFQKKCIGKMGDVARQGRTVLFVSHNMGAISNLCTKGMLLDCGQVSMYGEVSPILSAYLRKQSGNGEESTRSWRRSGKGGARITSAKLCDASGEMCTNFIMGQSLILEFDVEFEASFPSVNLSLEVLRSEMGMHVLHIESQDCGYVVESVSPGLRRFRVEIPNCLLYPASYEIMLCLWTAGGTLEYVQGVAEFSMSQSNVTRRTTSLSNHREAIYFAPSKWEELSNATP